MNQNPHPTLKPKGKEAHKISYKFDKFLTQFHRLNKGDMNFGFSPFTETDDCKRYAFKLFSNVLKCWLLFC